MNPFEELPSLSAKEAYLAMLEFLRIEFDITGPDKTVHLGGLLAEMELEPTGDSADPGAVQTFVEAVGRVIKHRS